MATPFRMAWEYLCAYYPAASVIRRERIEWQLVSALSTLDEKGVEALKRYCLDTCMDEGAEGARHLLDFVNRWERRQAEKKRKVAK